MMYIAAWLLAGLLIFGISLPLRSDNRGPTLGQLLFYTAIGPVTLIVFVWWTHTGRDSKLKGWLDKPLW